MNFDKNSLSGNKNHILFTLFLLTIILSGLLLEVSSSAPTSSKARKKRSKNFELFNYNVEKMYNVSSDSLQRNKNFHRQLSVTNLSEFVARIKGGIREAEELAQRFNLRLVRQVFVDSNYFLFEKEIPNTEDQYKNSKIPLRIRRSLESDEIKDLESDPMVILIIQLFNPYC